MVSLEDSTKCLKKNSNQIYTIFPENRRGRNTSQLISLNQCYPDTKTRQRQYKKRKTTDQYLCSVHSIAERHSKQHLRSIQNKKEKIKLSLFANDIIVYNTIPRNLQKPLRTNKCFQQGLRIQDWHTKINCISMYYPWAHGNQNLKYNAIYNQLLKNEILRCKSNKIYTRLVC